jgi:hypothetical protein
MVAEDGKGQVWENGEKWGLPEVGVDTQVDSQYKRRPEN